MKLSEALKCLPYAQSMALLKYLMNKNESDILVMDDISDDVENNFIDAVSRVKSGNPIEYITSSACFYGLDFIISSDVLIPRVDSEVLASAAIANCCVKNPLILEMFCGSGCVGISVAKGLDGSKLMLADVSKPAIDIAKKNVGKHRVDASFIQIDLLKDVPNGKFDIIIANPPYIRSDEIQNLSNSVKDFEPHLALDGGNDGVMFYRRIYEILSLIAEKNARVFLEIGYDQAQSVSEIFAEYNPNLILDFAQNPRVIWFTL